MRSSLLAAILAVSLGGQQGIEWQKPRPAQQAKGNSPSPGKFAAPKEIQRIKDQCRSRLIVGADTLFEANQSGLASGAEKVLSDLGPMIRKEGIHPISIEGHTDESNQTLSEQRARTVEAWLESRGYVIPTVTEVHGFGNTKPVAPNQTPEGRQKNRRVEIVINTCKS